MERPGIEAVPLSHGPVSRAYQLHHLGHRNPVDRLFDCHGDRAGLPAGHLRRIARFSKQLAENTGSPLPHDLPVGGSRALNVSSLIEWDLAPC
jgi:hypothetical protein